MCGTHPPAGKIFFFLKDTGLNMIAYKIMQNGDSQGGSILNK